MRSPQVSRSLGRSDTIINVCFLGRDALDSSMISPLTHTDGKVPPSTSRRQSEIKMCMKRTATNLHVLDGGIARVHRTTILD